MKKIDDGIWNAVQFNELDDAASGRRCLGLTSDRRGSVSVHVNDKFIQKGLAPRGHKFVLFMVKRLLSRFSTGIVFLGLLFLVCIETLP